MSPRAFFAFSGGCNDFVCCEEVWKQGGGTLLEARSGGGCIVFGGKVFVGGTPWSKLKIFIFVFADVCFGFLRRKLFWVLFMLRVVE